MIWIYIALVYTISVVLWYPLATWYSNKNRKELEEKLPPYINLDEAIKATGFLPVLNTMFTIMFLLIIPVEQFQEWNFKRRTNRAIKNINKMLKAHGVNVELPSMEEMLKKQEELNQKEKEKNNS